MSDPVPNLARVRALRSLERLTLHKSVDAATVLFALDTITLYEERWRFLLVATSMRASEASTWLATHGYGNDVTHRRLRRETVEVNRERPDAQVIPFPGRVA